MFLQYRNHIACVNSFVNFHHIEGYEWLDYIFFLLTISDSLATIPLNHINKH